MSSRKQEIVNQLHEVLSEFLCARMETHKLKAKQNTIYTDNLDRIDDILKNANDETKQQLCALEELKNEMDTIANNLVFEELKEDIIATLRVLLKV